MKLTAQRFAIHHHSSGLLEYLSFNNKLMKRSKNIKQNVTRSVLALSVCYIMFSCTVDVLLSTCNRIGPCRRERDSTAYPVDDIHNKFL